MDDDDIFRYIKEFYCANNRTAGECTTELNAAFDCWASNCGNFTDDQCVEQNCKSQIDSCFDTSDCGFPLLAMLSAQTECDSELSDIDDCCPSTCDDVDKSDFSMDASDECSDFTECGSDEYYACADHCEVCYDEVFQNMILTTCGNGECGTSFTDLFVCIIEECPDEDPDDDGMCVYTTNYALF